MPVTSPTPSPRWPALRGLRIFFARDIGLVLAALFAPFTAALCYLRRAGLEGTGTWPDPESLPERLAERFREGLLDTDSFFVGLVILASVAWLIAGLVVVAAGLAAVFGGTP